MDLYTVRKDLSMGISFTNMKLRVTYYSRVSTDSSEQKKSLQNQVQDLVNKYNKLIDEKTKEKENELMTV